jgi:hypothetical protein
MFNILVRNFAVVYLFFSITLSSRIVVLTFTTFKVLRGLLNLNTVSSSLVHRRTTALKLTSMSVLRNTTKVKTFFILYCISYVSPHHHDIRGMTLFSPSSLIHMNMLFLQYNRWGFIHDC